jgi:acetate kinase
MKILVLNCGSSSIKYALYDMTDQSVITSGGIEKIGLPDSCIIVKLNGEKHKMERPIEEHTAGVQWIFEVLTTGDYAVLNSLEELDAVGHRMVHGGEKFNKSVVLTPRLWRHSLPATTWLPCTTLQTSRA